MSEFKFIHAESVDEASELLKQGNAILSAGSTDIMGIFKDNILPKTPETVISLKKLEDLDYIKEDEAGVRIGANTTLSSVADSEVIQNHFEALADAAYSVATPNIRNRATIAGNIMQDIRCWYYRYPDSLGGMVNCARKDGDLCYAMMGENRYHSIFGGAKVNITACTTACPARTDISSYMELMREGKIEEAAQVLLEVNPMPSLTSRVCAHFCMEDCSRNEYDETMNIGSVERYLGDYILDNHERLMPKNDKDNGKSVAIIGSGPSGLTAAYYLRQAGYNITIYEKQPEAGGCLMYAIPAYRLPLDLVRRYIDIIEGLGIEIITNAHVGENYDYQEIKDQHDVVMLDSGTWGRPLIGLKGEEATEFGLDFLIDVNKGNVDKVEDNIVVVGGGNVAMDVAITAKRYGAKNVQMVCLETMAQMPANKEEIERALEEDVEIINSYGPTQVIFDGDKVTGLEFRKCISVRDEEGNFNPTYDDNDLITLDADVIYMAIGQKADLSYLGDDSDVEVEYGRVKAGIDKMTGEEGVFVGGDALTGPSTVIEAIANGKMNAISIHRHLKGEGQLPVVDRLNKRLAEKNAKNKLEFNENAKFMSESVKQDLLPKSERGLNKEDLSGISNEQAIMESNRCFNCGCLAVNSSDVANMLLALNAEIITNIRTITAEDLFTEKTKVQDVLLRGEVVTEVYIPYPHQNSIASYDKYRLREAIDFAVLAVASNYVVEDNIIKDANIILGACAPVPHRAKDAEKYLVGKELTQEVMEEAAELALKGAIPLDKNAYKIEMAKVMVRRSLENLKVD